MEKLYCISGKGTIWSNAENLICIKAIADLYYCPSIHVLFQRVKRYTDKLNEYSYKWETAILPALDKKFNDIQQIPFWEMNICHIDEKPLILSDKEFEEMMR